MEATVVFKRIVIAAVVIAVVGIFAYALYTSSRQDDFKTIYGVFPSAKTDTQKALIQADVKKTIVDDAAQVSDLQSACNGTTAAEVQSCARDKLDSLRGAESTLNDAVSVATFFDYDVSYSQEDIAAYKKAKTPNTFPAVTGGSSGQ